jgi:chromosome segregation ATPase
MTETEVDCTNIEIDNTKEEILKELAALKDSIRKIESSCNESISFLEIKIDAIGQELCNFKQSNNSTNYQIGTLVGEIERCKTDIMEIREMILHIDYWLSNSGIKEESKNSNIQNLKKENEELKKRIDELTTENQLIGIKNLEDEFCRDAFNMTIDSYSQENHKLKKAFGAINMILNQVQG